MKENLKGITLPDCLLFDGNIIYEASGYNPFLSIKKLKQLKKNIESTLKYYQKYSYTEQDIEIFNKKSSEHLFDSHDIKEKPKKNVGKDLYLMINTTNNTLKIGRSNNPITRLKQLNTASSDRIELICIHEDFGDAEIRIHKKFEKFKLNGEWFIYSQEIVDFMKDFSIFSKF
jgi:hypothetical protein